MDIESTIKPSPQWQRQVWPLLFLGCVGLLLLGLNMRRGLNHDEHQFIASGALLAREGLLPYGDYPYFHMPTLVFIYAALFQFSERLLLVARLFSITCSWLTVVLLFIHARGRSTLLSQTWQLLWPICCTLLLISSELFIYTSGRAWNHDLPVLLTIGAILACGHALTKGSQKYIWHWLFWIGLLIGMAISTRLSFAFTALALVAVIAIERGFRGIIAFGCGSVVSSLPAIYLFWRFPSQFMFGNVEYIQLNTQYFAGLNDPPATMNLLGKLSSALFTFLEPANLPLLVLFIITLWLERSALWTNLKLRLFVMAWIFTLLGAFSATPSQTQYFYPLMPLMAFTMVELSHHAKLESLYKASPFIFIVLFFAITSRYTMGMEILMTPDEWYPNRLHAHSQTIANLASDGPALTLAPTYPLEAGQTIYPALATGPFAWRVSNLLPPARRVELNLPDSDDLNRLFKDGQPRSILTGLDNDESKLEQPLIDYAQRAEYMSITMPDEGTLWLSPLHKWGDAIQIGGHTLPREPIEPGSQHQITFYLQNSAPIDQNLNMVVRMIDAANTEIWRTEGWPWGAATSDWQIGDVWPDGRLLLIPLETAPGIYRVEMGFYEPGTLDALSVTDARSSELLGDDFLLDYVAVKHANENYQESSPIAYLGDAFILQDIDRAGSVEPGQEQHIHLQWRTIKRPMTDYTVFIHLMDGDNRLIAQHDAPPMQNFIPTHLWRKGMVVNDVHLLTLPVDMPQGEYRILIGLYNPATGERMPVTQEGISDQDVVTGPVLTFEE